MTKATRVHSTPRRTASKVQHPPAKKPAKVTDADRAALNADLYLALENPACECARMADIALDAQCSEKDYAFFAVGKLCEMVLSLREIYYGREAGPIMDRS
jgi:hypothetical protein